VRGSAALHDPAVGGDLVGTVDGDVQPGDSLERLDGETEGTRLLLRAHRRRNKAERQASRREGGEEVRDRRAGAEPDGHAVFDELGGRLGRVALFVLDSHTVENHAVTTRRRTNDMARILVHSATGPDDPTRAALALLIAKTAAKEGHEVQVFLAGDGVHLANPETAEATSGLGTGSVAEHLADLRNAGLTVFLSGMSSKARGIDGGEGFELAPPQKLVELAVWAEATLTY
jgi:predicted peroxiredoxin